MLKQLKQNWILGLPLLIALFLVYLTQSVYFQAAPNDLALGITADFLLTIPFVYYLLIRKRDIPKYTVISVFIVCVILASFILPSEHQGLLSQVKRFVVPVLEIGILSFVIWKVVGIRKSFKANDQSSQPDFYEQIQQACTEVLPKKVGELFATEISVFYYIFARAPKTLAANEYTYFKKSGVKALLGVLLVVVLIETAIVHILVSYWSHTVAAVLTFLGLYAGLQIFSIVRSMNHRPIRIDEEKQQLRLCYGFYGEVLIPFSEIKQVELHKKSLPKQEGLIRLTPFDMLESHNTLIHLKSEHSYQKIYGLKKQFTSMALFLDEREQFITEIDRILDKNTNP